MWESDIKKAECQIIDAFKLSCWKRLFESPLHCKEFKAVSPQGNQSLYASEGLMLKLKLQYFGHLTHWKRPWCWERLKAGGERDDRRWDGWMALSTQWTWVWVNSGSWWCQGSLGLQRVGHDWVTKLNWYIHRDRYKGICLLKCIYKDEERGSMDLEQELEMREDKLNDPIPLHEV